MDNNTGQVDYFAALPQEVLLLVFSYLDTNTLVTSCRVCTRWKQLCEDNELWRIRFEQAALQPLDYYLDSLGRVEGSWKRLYLKELLQVQYMNPDRAIIIGTAPGGFVTKCLPWYVLQELKRYATFQKTLSSCQGEVFYLIWTLNPQSRITFGTFLC